MKQGSRKIVRHITEPVWVHERQVSDSLASLDGLFKEYFNTNLEILL